MCKCSSGYKHIHDHSKEFCIDMNNINKRLLVRLVVLIALSTLPGITARGQSIFNVCSGNTYQYAYCNVNPSAPNCNACTLSSISGDASGYIITRGDFNGAYTTTINWLKPGTYRLLYSCETGSGRIVEVGQG